MENGIADFSGGAYYDQFSGDEADLPELHRCGLCNESSGAEARIEDFYLPLIERHREYRQLDAVRVLDSGCGNGKSVELLSSPGIEAWGNDLSALRKWQWQDLDARDRLVVADTRKLPFPDEFFDVVLSSGVLEHVGVDEIGGESYSVAPRGSRDEERLAFLGELLRVVRSDGVMYLDFPNGSFPIDFWHGTVPGGARFHSLSEGFLPKTTEIRRYLGSLGGYELRPLSPRTRLRMRQVGQHWWGKLLRAPMRGLLWAMEQPGLEPLAASPLNPYLILEIRNTA
ncbi:MAG: class I SAM-dependent methyltransferase [Thermoanaerobaculia bacterium]|nr:class I SAM-dependent methyltransferase [Thermoanaerobaculia bacterium]